MKKILFIISILNILFAQTSGNIGVETVFTGGNVKQGIFTSRGEFSYSDSIIKPVINISFAYGEENNIKKQHDLNLKTRLVLLPYNLFALNINGLYEFNYQRKIDIRYQFGLGSDIKIYNDDVINSNTVISVLREETKYNRTNNAYFRSFRSNLSLINTIKFDEYRINFNTRFDVNSNLEQIKDYRWKANIIVEFALNGKYSFTTSYTGTYENIVLPERVKLDNKYMLGFSAKI
ncbi:MAG TPA: DUF481 domain-containing protein [Ignavibacteriales bacterium]|nr:DUF481 domain-containing protein [Ignavibacteriales bacterium]HOL82303.1 DUF481 domain-containing protein [Ignavibacteriales bacterium]HOM66332.1 DUF481 domain-containing protein [Ignavibacteriales bacterium]HPP34516.1 DUF481 domain-containing protein [Ignavibacteriales bacterium]HRR19690.1 DUF481 domain-containing protein [Ignavibacteriales bacterium]